MLVFIGGALLVLLVVPWLLRFTAGIGWTTWGRLLFVLPGVVMQAWIGLLVLIIDSPRLRELASPAVAQAVGAATLASGVALGITLLLPTRPLPPAAAARATARVRGSARRRKGRR